MDTSVIHHSMFQARESTWPGIWNMTNVRVYGWPCCIYKGYTYILIQEVSAERLYSKEEKT